MTLTAIIGGSGLTRLDTLVITERRRVSTPFGEPSAPLTFGELAGHPVVFLARHGDNHTYPPHRVNYRANIRALQDVGAERIIAVNAVGGITPRMAPRAVVIPDQVVDYTYGRAQTYFEDDLDHVTHIDITYPYCADLRGALLEAATSLEIATVEGGVHGVTQGPRLETAAEIRRLERDGCDIVGMTGMPEAALARELDLCYATCALVVNWAAGKAPGVITEAEMGRHIEAGMVEVKRLLAATIPTFAATR